MRRLFAAYRRGMRAPGDMLHAARLVSPGGIPGVLTAEAKARVRKRAEAFAEKAVHRSEREYESGAFSRPIPAAARCCSRGTAASFGQVYTLDNELGLADDFFCRRCLNGARSVGAARIVCPDPVDPESSRRWILPEMDCRSSRCPAISALTARLRGTSGSTRRRSFPTQSEAKSAAPPRCAVRSRRRRVPRCGGQKELHDELEAVYHPFVDFRADAF